MSTNIIASALVTSNSPIINISNIPSTYSSLELNISFYGSSSAATFPTIKFNNSQNSNDYCQTWMFHNAPTQSTVFSTRSILRDYVGPSITSVDFTGNKLSSQRIIIADYSRTDKWKTLISEANDQSKLYGGMSSAIWKSLDAITSIQIFLVQGLMAPGTRVTLIGRK